ncbi:CDP-glycerol glycerophosphotransferase family protein [Lederbergia citri]|uniref:CDP-glycerol glycerophosphotransferase family protein n=1 Tax=Lederbergia citri TaxID=2833580 RepID=A0A942TCW5_9BACI|nr:CDP-glycerol glycerophosphotransferase family protein [Lederbergia citri]MBS4195495.1 CDP-glycerol glycerophosphotransferase family protein [Lederbergia citri]
MLNIIIFGTGSSAEKFLTTIDTSKVKVICFTDNDYKKHFKKYHGYDVFPPNRIPEFNFDYIFIASQYSIDIMQQLLELGVFYQKIIPTDYTLHNALTKSRHEDIYKNISIKEKQTKYKLEIGLINYNYSNYNGYSLFKNMPNFISEKYKVELIEEKKIDELKTYDVICSSHFDGIYEGEQINIEMWHGFPLKQMGVINEGTVNDQFLNYQQKRIENTHLILSYSQLYNTFFNSCFPSNAKKYKITGMPRNDLLFEKGSLNKLEKIVNKKLNNSNIIFYLPTWRKGKNYKKETNKEWNQLIGFGDENEESFVEMVEKNNLFVVVKLHPFEFNTYKDLNIFKHERIFLLSDTHLVNKKIHLYEILGAAKLLITDYSSVFFDSLLIDLPVIFAPIDLKEYSESRGFLIEPYDYLTPGPTVHTLKELEKEIIYLIKGQDAYKNKRAEIKSLIFKYFDNKSSLRVWTEIDNYLESCKNEKNKLI